MIEIIGWSSFQSYKDRKPPWVRLHKSLLDNFEFQQMSADARALLPMLWLLASEDIDPLSGCIRSSFDKIAFRLRMDIGVVTKSLYEINQSGFILLKQSCIESVTKELRVCYETVTPETEAETETETEIRDKSMLANTKGVATATRSETAIRDCIAGRRAFIKQHYPHVNLEVETEEIVAKYRHQHIGADPWMLVSRWLKNIPDRLKQAAQQPKTFAQIRSENNKQAVKNFVELMENRRAAECKTPILLSSG